MIRRSCYIPSKPVRGWPGSIVPYIWVKAGGSGRPLRRLSALGYLSGHASVETVRLLRDYLAWEQHPMLLRRADAVVRRMDAKLG